MSQSKLYKPVLIVLCLALLLGVSQIQRGLNREREKLGLTRMPPLENAPPILAFTTVALGGFRGLISNALWIRANDLQENDKYFEMVQLADWITKLEPHFTQVWLVQAWNMAYNISVKFKDPQDRWRWVERGISLLRDEALRYNPDDRLIYRELSWIFQHKMGQNLDDAHQFYKQAWFEEMNPLVGKHPNFDALLHPKTAAEKERAQLLREKYKMDPQAMKEVDEKYGPLEWRLPEAHAIYWAELGVIKGKGEDKEKVRRSIYQTMQQNFRRGALYENKIDGSFSLGPNLDAIPNVNKSYEDPMMQDDEKTRDYPKTGHKNFLKDAVYFLYLYNRRPEAEKWYSYLKEKYTNAIPDYIKEKFPKANPNAKLSLDEFTTLRVTEDVGETDPVKIQAVLGGLIAKAYLSLAQDDDEAAANYERLAQSVYNRFTESTKGSEVRVKVAPINQIKKNVREELLDSQRGLPPEAAARLRTKLGLPGPKGK